MFELQLQNKKNYTQTLQLYKNNYKIIVILLYYNIVR